MKLRETAEGTCGKSVVKGDEVQEGVDWNLAVVISSGAAGLYRRRLHGGGGGRKLQVQHRVVRLAALDAAAL